MASTIEERLAAMALAIEQLTKTVADKDVQIASLVNKLEGQATGETSSGSHRVQDDDQKDDDQEKSQENPHQKQKEEQSCGSNLGALSVQQLQDMITNTIRAQYGGPSRSSLTYSKPYTRRIDNLKFPVGYQPPKLQLFDGKGNPRQHIAHFVETCNTAGTEGDFLVKQFVRSLKGNAFEWYTDLEAESIDSWDQMEKEFLNRFYSTRRTVSMMELTSTKQRKEELVVDYINRWRALSLDCKDRLSEISAVEMCMQGMNWGLHYILQGIKPRTFEELATRAHDMEISIANYGKDVVPMVEPRPEMKEWQKEAKPVKVNIKESMAVTTTPLKIPKRDARKDVRTVDKPQEKQRPTLKDLEEKVYPFPDSDVPDILDYLLEKKVIELPDSKRPQEATRVHDPKYCKYHRVISHSTEKCFILKELIMSLAKQGKIALDADEVVGANVVSSELDEDKSCKNHEDDRAGSSCTSKESDVVLNASCWAAISFTDEDLQLGSKLHNRPLFVSGFVQEQKVDRMLVDGGSAVNIMPKSTMKQLGITMDELSKSQLIIQGFDQGGRRAIGMIRLGLSIEELESNALFYVIDAKTSYNLLLGRPWLHENGVVPSTLHQCFKFYRDGVKTVVGDTKPFTEAESHYADAKFYNDADAQSEVLLKAVPLIGKSTQRQEIQAPKEVVEDKNDKAKDNYPAQKEVVAQSAKETPVFKYIPVSRRQKGQSPFQEVKKQSSEGKLLRVVEKNDITKMKKDLVIPLTKLEGATSSRKERAKSSGGNLQNKFLPSTRTKDGFDPIAYKLMANSGYDFSKPSDLGKLNPEVTGKKEHGLNETQRKLKLQGHKVDAPKTGLGYTPEETLRIPLKSKGKKASVQHITVEEVQDGAAQESASRTSVFDRLQPAKPKPAVFAGLGASKVMDENKNTLPSTRVSIFKRLEMPASRLKATASQRGGKSIFTRLSDGVHKKPDDVEEPRKSVFLRLKKSIACKDDKKLLEGGDGEVKSSIPSRMKRRIVLEVNQSESLKVKRKTIVHTRTSEEDKASNEPSVATNHVKFKEDKDEGEIKHAPLNP